MESILDRAHTLAIGAIRDEGAAVDATVGNGHDTVMLARAVGDQGQVFGFDVQPEALRATRSRLASDGCADRVALVEAGHETMAQHVPEALRGRVDAVTFNLGYLPGSDCSLTTSPSTTIPALDAAVRLLRPGGRITVVVYTGHEGGAEEAAAVDAWAADLPQPQFEALSYRFVNRRNDPPRLVAVEKTESPRDP